LPGTVAGKLFLHFELRFYFATVISVGNEMILPAGRGQREKNDPCKKWNSSGMCHVRQRVCVESYQQTYYFLLKRRLRKNIKMNENKIATIIIGKAIEVHKVLGPGLLENAYKECLAYKLEKSGLYVEKEKPMPLVFEQVKLNCGYRIDILVETKVVLEIKSVESLADVHLAQTLTYLRLGQFKLGLLMNFNVAVLKTGIKRVINGRLA